MVPSFVLLSHIAWNAHVRLGHGRNWVAPGQAVRCRRYAAFLREVYGNRGLRRNTWILREEVGRGGRLHAHLLLVGRRADIVRAVLWYRQKYADAHFDFVSRRPWLIGYALHKLDEGQGRWGGNQVRLLWISESLRARLQGVPQSSSAPAGS